MKRAAAAACAAVLVCSSGANAQAVDTAAVDRAVQALAEVLKERAKQVAAHTVQRKVIDELCAPAGKERVLQLNYPVGGADGGMGLGTLTLYLGGRVACQSSAADCL